MSYPPQLGYLEEKALTFTHLLDHLIKNWGLQSTKELIEKIKYSLSVKFIVSHYESWRYGKQKRGKEKGVY